MPDELSTALTQSVQNTPKVNTDSGTTSSGSVGFWFYATERGDLLPAWGTRERERWLRAYDRHNFNNLWQGAANGLINKFANTPSQLTGGRNLTARFDNILRYSQRGSGQRALKKLVGRDYLRFDGGAYVEIIAPGNPLKAPTGAVTGLAHLDSYHCIPTGDPEYPVVYYNSIAGKKPTINVLHHTRVMRFVDMPDGDQDNPGYGLCALSRVIAIAVRQIHMGRYTSAKLDDKPEPGIVLATGMNRKTWEEAWTLFRQQQSTDLKPEWGKNLPIFGMDAALEPKLQMFAFANAPEKFDFKVYVEIDVHELALGIGVDIQDLWELTSGNLGSSGQSEIQHAKSRGNTLGDMLNMWEQAINNYVLPESLEYEHKTRDPYEANERAQNAQTWAGFLQSAGDALTAEEKRQILANQVEAVADAIIDDSGELIRLDDADPKADEQQLRVVEDSAPNAPVEGMGSAQSLQLQLVKDFDATRQAFVAAFEDLASAGQDGDLTRRRAGTVLRANISRLGRQAYADGLKAGGVEDAPSDADLNAIALLVAEQSQYVTAFLDTLYSDGVADVNARAEMWFNKSIAPFYQAGLASADADGLYEWTLGDSDHCPDCQRMAGQKHRLKEYVEKGILPQASTLSCGGYNCACGLTKTTGRSKGNWI